MNYITNLNIYNNTACKILLRVPNIQCLGFIFDFNIK